MKIITILFTAMLSIQSTSSEKAHDDTFRFSYAVVGLGSNIGTMQPTIRINGTKLIYTFEQNSYFGEKTKSPDTIMVATLRQTSIDSILLCIGDLKDTSIYESNPCIMSGGIHYMTISSQGDTTRFTLHNTFHRTALKISDIINQYLPIDKKIWATEQDIIDCEKCWDEMFGRKDKMKKE